MRLDWVFVLLVVPGALALGTLPSWLTAVPLPWEVTALLGGLWGVGVSRLARRWRARRVSRPSEVPDAPLPNAFSLDPSHVDNAVLQRLIAEIQADGPDPAMAYDRVHNRHNRGNGRPYPGPPPRPNPPPPPTDPAPEEPDHAHP